MEQILLPKLNNFKSLSEKQVQEFQRDGHILIKGLAHERELLPFRKIIAAAVDKHNTEKRKLEERDTYGKAFLQVMNLWQSDRNVKQFVLAKRFAKVACQLLGVSNVRIYHDQALFKEAGGGPTPWHQDQYYWPIDTHNTVTMWMPLININAEMGMLTFASGSHLAGSVIDREISDESEQEFERYIARKEFSIVSASEMKAGDATFHFGYTIHKAPANKSQTTREVMTIIYVADGARIIKPKNKWQVNDHQTWLMNTSIGELMDSLLNPLIL